MLIDSNMNRFFLMIENQENESDSKVLYQYKYNLEMVAYVIPSL